MRQRDYDELATEVECHCRRGLLEEQLASLAAAEGGRDAGKGRLLNVYVNTVEESSATAGQPKPACCGPFEFATTQVKSTYVIDLGRAVPLVLG